MTFLVTALAALAALAALEALRHLLWLWRLAVSQRALMLQEGSCSWGTSGQSLELLACRSASAQLDPPVSHVVLPTAHLRVGHPGLKPGQQKAQRAADPLVGARTSSHESLRWTSMAQKLMKLSGISGIHASK